MDLFSLYATIGLKDDGFKSGINNATKSTTGLTSGVKNLVSTVASIKLVSTAFNMITSSISSAVERYDTLNRFPTVLELMGYSAEEAASATSKLSEGIQGLPTSLNDIVSNAQKLTTLTGNLEESTDTTLALNNAMIASGSTTADVTRGTTQYVQMLSKGKADIVSWRTLQETMGFALREVSESMLGAGSSSNDLYDALKGGSVTFDDVNTKLVELSTATGGFADMAKESSGGIGTSWTNMQIAITRGVTNIISSIDTNLTNTSLPNLQQSIEMVGDGFEGALNIMADVAGGIIKTVAPAIKLVGKNMDVVVPVLGTITAGFIAYNAAMAISSTIKKTIAAIELARNAMAAASAVTGIMTVSLGANATAETVRTAAKAAGMTVDAAGNIITVAGTVATTAETAALLSSTGAITAKTLVTGVLTGTVGIATAAQMLWNAAMAAETAALLSSTGAITAKTLVTGVLTGTVGIATAAQMLWNAAMAANPIGLVIAGVAGLVAGIVGLIKWLNKESEASKELRKENEALAESADELNDSLEASSDAYKDNEKAIEAEAIATKNLAAKVAGLAEEENRSTEQKKELRAYVNALNDSMSDLGLEYDYETDSLNMSTDAIYNKIDAYKEQAEAQAAQTRYTEILKEQMEVGEQLTLVEKQLEEAETARFVEGSINNKEYQKLTEELTELEAEYQAQHDSLAESAEYVEGVMVSSYAAEAEAATNTAETVVTGVETIAESYDTLAVVQQTALDGILSAYETMTGSLSSLTEQIVRDDETTWVSIQENQANVIAETQKFTDLYAQLIQAGISESYLDAIGATGPESIPLLEQMLASGTDTVLASQGEWENAYGTINDTLVDSLQLDGDAAVAIKDYVTGEAGIAGSLKSAIESADFTTLGLGLMQGVEEGINTGSTYASDSMAFAADDIESAWREKMDQHSPSQVFVGLGEGLMEGLENGITDGSTGVLSILSELASSMSKLFEGSGAELGDGMSKGIKASLLLIPSTIGTSLAPGIKIISSWTISAQQALNTGLKLSNNTVVTSFATMNSTTRNGMNTFKSTIVNIANTIPAPFQSALSIMTNQVIVWGTNLTAKGQSGVISLKNIIESTANSISLYSAGQNVVDGMWNGMQSKQSIFYTNVYNFFQGMVTQAKKALEIASPSKVMATLGGFTVEGFIVGLENMSTKLDNVMNDIFTPDLSDLQLTTNVTGNGQLAYASVGSGTTEGMISDRNIVQNIYVQSVAQTPYEIGVQAKNALNRARWA